MNNCCYFLRSSIGKKWVVAITGVILLGFVITHLIGNLQVFLGPGDAVKPAKLNSYAAFLSSLGYGLWILRIGLIVAAVLHVVFTIQLVVQNRAAKGGGAQFKKKTQPRVATSTMILSGTYILCFVIFHLAHYTWLLVYPEWRGLYDVHGLHDVYGMLLEGFSRWWVSIFYIVGMILLAMHLGHGIESSAQTLGVQTQRIRGCFKWVGRTLAVVIAVGFISIPVAVMAGYGKEYREHVAARLAAAKEGN